MRMRKSVRSAENGLWCTRASFGGRAPCRTAPMTGMYSSSSRRGGGAQQQPATAHVATPDERRQETRGASRKSRSAPGRIFPMRCCRAARTPQRRRSGRQARCAVCSSGAAIRGISEIDVRVGESDEHLRGDRRVGRHQPLIRRDDERAPELLRVGDLAAEVQPAHVREELANGHALAAKTRSHGKRRFRRQHLLRAAPAAVRGREQKDARGHSPDFTSATLPRSRGQHGKSDEKQHQRRKREIPGNGMERAAASACRASRLRAARTARA